MSSENLIISGQDSDIKLIELPQLKGKEIYPFLSYRLRSIYPGNPEETIFDYSIFRSKKRKSTALLCIMNKNKTKFYKEKAGNQSLLHPINILCNSDLLKGEKIIYVHWLNDFLILHFRDGIPVSFYTATGKIKPLFNLLPKNYFTLPAICIDHESGLKYFVKQVSKYHSIYSDISIEKILLKYSHKNFFKKRGFFIESKKRIPLKVFLPVTGIILISILLFVGTWYGKLSVNNSEELQNEISALHFNSAAANITGEEVLIKKGRLLLLLKNKPVPVYNLISDLSKTLGPDVFILNLTVKDNGFHLEAIGADPLMVISKLEKHPLFQNVEPGQIITLPNRDLEQFFLSGTYIRGSVILSDDNLPKGSFETEAGYLERQINFEADRFYTAGEIDPYSFAQEIRNELENSGILIGRYKIFNENLTEFTFKGKPESVMIILRRLSKKAKHCTIYSLLLNMEKDNMLSGSFIAGFELLPDYKTTDSSGQSTELPGPEAISPVFLSSAETAAIFSQPAAFSTASTAQTDQTGNYAPVTNAEWLSLVSIIQNDKGGTTYYFKDSGNGRVLPIIFGEDLDKKTGSWSIVEMDESFFILQNKNQLYSVNRR